MLFKNKVLKQNVDDSMICFDPKITGKGRVHDAALRFVEDIKDSGVVFDIEVAGMIHLFVKACGVTQEELNVLYKYVDD